MPIITALAALLAVQVPDLASARLVWDAPRDCPGREDLLAAIEQRLGRAFAGEVEVEARVTHHADAPRFRLTMRLGQRGRAALRRLTSGRCAALVDAAALLVATAVSPGEATEVQPGADAAQPIADAAGEVAEVEAREEPIGPELAPQSRLEQTAEQAPELPPAAAELEVWEPAAGTAETPLEAPRRARRGPGGVLRIQGGAELGALPGVSGAAMVVGGLLWRRARLELRGTFLSPRTEVRPEGSLRAFAGMGAVLGCGRPGPRRVEFPLCGGLELGGVRGTATRAAGARGTTGYWLAIVASAGVAVAVHPRVRLGAALEGVAGLLVPSFELRDPGPDVALFTSSRISGRLLFTVELHFRDPR
ncbi:hypothetical protein [Nannocystis punicea]|uniref:Outer membrane protein beta-barrel domain-containing protein n=1 Tax=Nannocystis punicea TaxID=2995304 RepID=A0ABY7HBN0_9BACT|nr:hypothetical protein [Nannocystis poenicansa]WAS96513.1 hypothetical protein O0S08_10180 [Nannocystis poenicansa]